MKVNYIMPGTKSLVIMWEKIKHSWLLLKCQITNLLAIVIVNSIKKKTEIINVGSHIFSGSQNMITRGRV